MRSKTSRGEGLVPRWGRVGAPQNPPCQTAVPSHNSNFSYLGVPAAAGMSDWYENDVTRAREWPHTTAPALVNPTSHSSFRRRPESRRGGDGSANDTQTLPVARTHFHILVCRRQPA